MLGNRRGCMSFLRFLLTQVTDSSCMKRNKLIERTKTEKAPATNSALIELENKLYGMNFVEISVPKCSIAGL